MVSDQVMTSKEYTAWLEVSLATSLSTIDRQMELIHRLTRDNIQIAEELFKNTKAIIQSPYYIATKEKQV